VSDIVKTGEKKKMAIHQAKRFCQLLILGKKSTRKVSFFKKDI